MQLYRDGRLGSGDVTLDFDLRDLEIVTLPGGTFLFATTGANGGLSAYALDGDGAPSWSGGRHFPARFAPLVAGELEVITTGGDRLLAFGGDGHGLAGYRLEADGSLGGPARTGGLQGGTAGISAMLWAAPGGRARLYLADDGTGRLSVYNGTVTGLAERPTGPTFPLRGAAGLATAEAGGQHFVLAADLGRQGVSSYLVSPGSGALQLADSLGMVQGLGVNAPTAMEVIAAHGTTWIVLAGGGSSSLSVMRLDTSGRLRATDHVLDTQDTRFGGVQALEVVEADGHVFVLAGGADDGLSLFALLPDGDLVHLDSLSHAGGDGLVDLTDIAAVRVGDAIRIFVTSEATGIGLFSVPVNQLGDVIRDRSPAGTRLTGTAGDDQILAAGTGTDTLIGGAGDDILVSGPGGSVMRGGAGADIFVIRSADIAHQILDFEAGVDRLDLSGLPMLRALAQLTVSPRVGGARIAYDGQEIFLRSHDGARLTADDIFGPSLGGPDRVLVLSPAPAGLRLTGTPRADLLIGGRGNDTLTGNSGPDGLWASDGDDRLFGGPGRDRMGGGIHDDEIWGGLHDDTAYGSAGDDTIGGGSGTDQLWAGIGNDLAFGGPGRDRIGAGPGDDTLWAGNDADTVYGSDGDDTIGGGDGDDEIWSGAGDDESWGGTDQDTVYGGEGDDTLGGGPGQDEIWAGEGDDTVWGGTGGDMIYGGAGDDWIDGKEGADVLAGGPGADLFVFAPGGGDDRITDFQPGEDRIRLTGAGLGFDDLSITSAPGGAEVDYGSGTILLDGVDPAELSASDFLFS